ncbi:MAG: diguanylate cyclase [Lachnospiraceae bacterium]|nr:diguanylate cyclase [Lachnospiraceae bacterium]
MMEDKTRSIAVQWLVPSGILAMVIVIMLFNFTTKSKLSANDAVTRNMTATAETCANKFKEQLTLLVTIGEPVAELLGDNTSLESVYAVKMARLAAKYSGAYMVFIVDSSGKGVDDTGEKISIAERDYFEEVDSARESQYFFIADDGIDGKSAIVTSIPIDQEEGIGHLLLFYPLNNFETVVKKNDFVSWTTVALIDETGMFLVVSGTGNEWKRGENLYDVLQGGNDEVVKKMKNRITNRVSSLASVMVNDLETSLVHVPIGINNWTIITGISQNFVDKQMDKQWGDVRTMMIQLVVVTLVFICLIVGINIAGKVINYKKQEQLEVKADTDLLTGLNNKLATERKIKEYIAKNSKSRAMMFIVDIDNFKKINDTMGHAFGDEVLRSFGQQIGSIFRASDIIGRVGGDEFFIFLKNIMTDETVRKEAKKVENFFHDFKTGEYTKYSATASIGVAIFPEEGEDFDSLYKAADKALYKAKKRGKNQLAFYNDSWSEEK